MKTITILNLIKKLLILFWALWFLLVAGSDIVNFLQEIKLLPSLNFNSNNFNLLKNVLLIYEIESSFFIQFIFIIIILFALLTSISFFISLFFIETVMPYFSFFLSFVMSLSFILTDEILIQYNLEHGHMLRFVLQIISFMCFYTICNYKGSFYNEKNI